jgi:hypothetical protein
LYAFPQVSSYPDALVNWQESNFTNDSAPVLLFFPCQSIILKYFLTHEEFSLGKVADVRSALAMIPYAMYVQNVTNDGPRGSQ